MEKIYFREVQKFDQWWLRLLIPLTWVPVVALFGTGLYRQLVLGKPWGNNPASDTGLIVTALFVFGVLAGMTFLLFSLKLITEVTDKGLRYRFPPLILKFRNLSAAEIAEYSIRKYNPVGEYGGWGLRQRRIIGNKGIAYNVSGTTGLQLILKNGKKILFGTQRPDACLAAMERLMKPTLP
jgi:hypothetical protein